MTIQTNTTDRKALVKAIAEELHTEARYLRTPTYAYEVGDFTVDRYGNIVGDDFAPLHDFLLRNGYITEEAETGTEAENEEADAPVEGTDVELTEGIALSADAEATDAASENDTAEADADLEAPVEAIAPEPNVAAVETVEDSEAETADDEEDTERGDDMKPITADTEGSADDVSNDADSDLEEEQHPADTAGQLIAAQTITIPAPGITVEQLRNLTFILYSRQYLLGLMTGVETIHIPVELIEALKTALPASPEDFTALLNSHRALGLKGFDFKAGEFTLTFPFCENEPAKWTTFAGLQGRILQSALAAKRVLPDLIQPEEEAEKYTAHIWLQRMGYKGPEMKEQRNILLHHLHGYCAFSNGA